MIFTFAGNFFVIISILGYSYIAKKFILNEKQKKLYLIDSIFGIFFLVFISISVNFFLALEYLTLSIFFIGIIIFFYYYFKNLIEINFLKLILLLIFFSFVFYDNGNNVDSAVYHIQSIKWSNQHKIPIGLSNLDWLYPLNSTWHSFLALYQIQIKNFSTIYVLNIIPLTIIFYEIFNNEKNIKKLSFLTLYFSGLYLIIFSVIHPFKNGVIFNHYGNPEVDSIAMCYFVLSSYLFLKFIENKNDYNFNLLLVSSFLCVTSKITYAGVVLFPIYVLIQDKFIFFKGKVIIISSLLSIIWMFRSFLLSSCFIYPVSLTCVNTSWFFGEEKITQLVNLTKGFSRDTRLREKYTDFEHVIYSYDWFIPWFNDYFLNTKMLLISTFLLFSSWIFLIIKYFFYKNIKINKHLAYFFILSFISNILIWFQAPEIRFGWGILIVYPCLFFAIVFFNIQKFNLLNSRNTYIFFIFIFFILSVAKNYKHLTYSNIIKPYEKKWDYSQIDSIGIFNGEEIFISNNWQCADFPGICVNIKKDNYEISKKYDYFIFLDDKIK